MGIIVPLVSASGCCCNGVYDNLCALERGSGRLQSLIITHCLPMESNGIIICKLSCPQNKAPGVQVLFIINSICCAKDGGRLFFLF